MKHILDSSFKYKPSFDTDVKRTFDRIRRETQPKPPKEEPKVKARLVLKVAGSRS